MGALEEVHKRYKERAAFYVVYIREAHPADGRQAQANVRDNVIINQPKTEEERQTAAQNCTKDLKITIPAILDGMDNAVERAYTTWPNRLYIVGKDGRIAYKGRPGPAGFNVREMAAALEGILAGGRQAP